MITDQEKLLRLQNAIRQFRDDLKDLYSSLIGKEQYDSYLATALDMLDTMLREQGLSGSVFFDFP